MQSDFLTQILLPLGLMFIMFSLGLGLRGADFKEVVRQPRAFAVGVACHFVLLPAVAFLLVLAFGVTGALAVGFMIIAACPTGTTSNLMTAYARGDVALAVSFTAFAGIVSIVSVPIVVTTSIGHFMHANQRVELSSLQMALQVFLMIGVPVAGGMALRERFPDRVARFERTATRLASVVFALIFVASIARHWALFRLHFPLLGPVAVSMNAAMLALGYAVSRLARVESRQAITVAIESSVQNGTLAIVVGSTLLGNETMILPGAVYSVVMCVNGLLFVVIARRWLARTRPAPASAPCTEQAPQPPCR